MITFSSESKVELIKSNATDIDVARAAWVSNFGGEAKEKEQPERVQGLINYLYREEHMSPFEHGSLTFFVETPLFVRSEIQRHRTFSYNEHSSRYSEMEPEFYIPVDSRPLIQQGKVGAYTFNPGTDFQIRETRRVLTESAQQAWTKYQYLLNIGVAKEVARNALTVSTYTRFYMTGNPRNWMQFLNLRTADNALFEIRDVANKIEDLFKQEMSLTHKAWKRYPRKTVDLLDTTSAHMLP